MLKEKFKKLTSAKTLQHWSSHLTKAVLNSQNIHNQTHYDCITTPPVQSMVRIEILPDGISPKILTTGEMELFIPMDCMVGPQAISPDVKIHITTSENAVWFFTPTSPLILHPLLISGSRVLVFQVSSTNTYALSRRDSTGTVIFVSRTQDRTEVQFEKAQATALQAVWAITPHQVIKPGVVLAEGAGATAYIYLERDDTPVFLPYHRLARALQSCATSACTGYISTRSTRE